MLAAYGSAHGNNLAVADRRSMPRPLATIKIIGERTDSGLEAGAALDEVLAHEQQQVMQLVWLKGQADSEAVLQRHDPERILWKACSLARHRP